MTDTKETKETWLPNLVGGVSIWKLAADLNQERFFDGRLLVPETEGSDSLPVKVLWTVEDLVPLAEARATHAEAVGVATTELLACVERVKKELSSDASGYKKFRDAFSIPGLDSDGEANYFFDPKSGKLCVINWGASPRSMAGKGEIVFGYDRFDELIARARGAAPAARAGAAAAAGGAAIVAGAAADVQKAEQPSDKDKRPEKKKRSVWFWLAIALGIIAAIILLGLLFHSCSEAEDHPDAGPSASDSATPKDAGADAADAGKDGGDAGDKADGGDAGDAGTSDAGADAGDAGTSDAGADAGDAGAGKDGGATSADNSGTPPQNGKVYVIVGDGGLPSPSGPMMPDGTPRPRPSRPVPFRSHYQPDATAWRITNGADVVDQDFPPAMNNGAFEVYLKPGHTFSEISVEYKDKAGNWHTH